MLATLGSPADIFDESDWAFEMKWDGIRAIATVDGSGLHLTSRNGIDQTVSYPELQQLVDLVGDHEAVLDGEVVTLDHRGRPDFGLLQTRMKLTRPHEVEAAAKRAPAHFMLFDLLELDGTTLVKQPYDDRRDALQKLVRPAKDSSIQVPPAFAGDLAHAVASSKELGLEGVMAKERDGTYTPGRRSRVWIKIKNHRDLEVVIVGWRPGNGRRSDTVGSLLLGFPDGDKLRYVGRVGHRIHGCRTRRPDETAETEGAQDQPGDAKCPHWMLVTRTGCAPTSSAKSNSPSGPRRAGSGSRPGVACAPTSPSPTSTSRRLRPLSP